MNYSVLVKNSASPPYDDGDIIAVADNGHVWGKMEGPPMFRIESISDDEFYRRSNLTLQLEESDLDVLPGAIKHAPRVAIKAARAVKRGVLKPRRYTLKNGKVQDKKNES